MHSLHNVHSFAEKPEFLTRAVMRIEPLKTDALSQSHLMLIASYTSGLIAAKDRILEQNPDVVLFPLRGAWSFAKVIQLSASLEKKSSNLPTFKYPPFSSHYFSKSSGNGQSPKNRERVFSDYFEDIKRFLDSRNIVHPKIMIIDEVLSGSSIVGTHTALKSFLNKNYGKDGYELTTIAICDQTHIKHTPSSGTKTEQLFKLVKEGFIVFTNKEMNLRITEGQISPKDLEASEKFLEKRYLFTEKSITPLIISNELRFKNERFNNLVKDGSICPIVVGKLFTTDSKHFLYELQKTTKRLQDAIFDFPTYGSGSFDEKVSKNLQLLLNIIENILTQDPS